MTSSNDFSSFSRHLPGGSPSPSVQFSLKAILYSHCKENGAVCPLSNPASSPLPPSLPPSSLRSPSALPLRAPRWSRGDRVRKWRPRDRMGKPGTLGPRSAGESVDVRSSPPWRSWDWGPRGGESTPGRSGELNLCSVFRKGMERVLLLRGDFPSTSMMIPAEMRMPRAE